MARLFFVALFEFSGIVQQTHITMKKEKIIQTVREYAEKFGKGPNGHYYMMTPVGRWVVNSEFTYTQLNIEHGKDVPVTEQEGYRSHLEFWETKIVPA